MRPVFLSFLILALGASAWEAATRDADAFSHQTVDGGAERAREQAGVSQAATVQPKRVLDLWDAAYLQGMRAGYVHTSVDEQPEAHVKLLRAAMELRLTVLRSGETIQLAMDAGNYETTDGKVVSTFLKHYLGTSKTLEISGIVDGNLLRLTLDKSKNLKPAPWNPEVIGLARGQRLFRERDLKPGDEFTYLSFEPSINLVVKTTVKAKDFEEVELLDASTLGGKQRKRLLRVESQAEKIQNVQLPALVSWVSGDLMPMRSEADIPPFGRVTLYRTTKANALGPGVKTSAATAKLTDIGTSQYVKLARRIANPYETTAALYRITIRDEDDPLGVFTRDERQTVRKLQGTQRTRSEGGVQAIELHVSTPARRASVLAPSEGASNSKTDEAKEPSSEYTQNSYFITCDDTRVKMLASKAVNGESDPWKKALRIEKWVNLNMKVTSDEALAPADHVARTLRGDCTEFAMLTAAMCRAQGIPSRTAVGLIYADVRGGPVFAFHMWTEVWIGKNSVLGTQYSVLGTSSGKWVPLDATLGKGQVGATHLKISDQSWHETYDQSPLLPVFRVLGKLSIEVLRTETR
jgi:transglutaminase-like putative cysteine protease